MLCICCVNILLLKGMPYIFICGWHAVMVTFFFIQDGKDPYEVRNSDEVVLCLIPSNFRYQRNWESLNASRVVVA